MQDKNSKVEVLAEKSGIDEIKMVVLMPKEMLREEVEDEVLVFCYNLLLVVLVANLI